MNKPYLEAEIKELDGNIKIYRIDAPFDKGLAAMKKSGTKYPLSARGLGYARTRVAKFKHPLNANGSWTRAGYLWIKNDLPLRAKISPLLSKKLAKLATQANRDRKYFSTEDAELYDEYMRMAEQDKDKDPKDRRVIVVPSKDECNISPKQNMDFFSNVFEDIGEEYLAFIGKDAITFYPVDKDKVYSNKGTILTQEWLNMLYNNSSLAGGSTCLDGDGNALRWVQEESQLANRPYTAREVDRIRNIVTDLNECDLSIYQHSQLNKVIMLLNKL